MEKEVNKEAQKYIQGKEHKLKAQLYKDLHEFAIETAKAEGKAEGVRLCRKAMSICCAARMPRDNQPDACLHPASKSNMCNETCPLLQGIREGGK